MPSRVGNGPIAPSKPPKPWRAERSRKGGSHLAFAVEHADRMRTVTICPGGSSLSHQCRQCCTGPVPPSLSQPKAEDRSQRPSKPRLTSGVRAYARSALRPAPLQSRLGYLPKAVSAGPAIPRGRRSGRPSSGCAQAAYEMGRIACGICPLPRSAAAFEARCIVSLRAASGMVSRGLVTTSITVSRDHHVTNDAMLSSVVPIERSHGVHSTGLHRGVPDPMAHRRSLRYLGRANLDTSSN